MSNPLLYEINTRCWLRELSNRAKGVVSLGNVPEADFAAWEAWGITHIWLMGVWTTGPRARAEALKHQGLREEYDRILPGWTEADVAGSPYAIADYQVPSALGGDSGLANFRQKLNRRGIKLVLDFVPNHLGVDHVWVRERPELCVQTVERAPDAFQAETVAGVRWLAHGKDPYFPGWTDTVQLDYRRNDTRAAMIELLQSVADRCDGVRCDMAMLVLNEVFAKTWANVPTQGDGTSKDDRAEFWTATISTVRARQPDFLFLSEVYWGLEGRLQGLGFDYTYDKELYDKLMGRDAAGVQAHLTGAPREFVAASAHFLENHDEPRVASRLSLPEQRAAALVILGLPGMRFLHEGQLAGERVKIPVQLGRRPAPSPDAEPVRIYEQLLAVVKPPADRHGRGVSHPKASTDSRSPKPGCSTLGSGRGQIIRPRAAWPDNPTAQNFVIILWQSEPLKFDLVVVNLAGHRSQCYAPLEVEGLETRNWSMVDLLGTERYERAGEDLERQGLYLDLPPHGAQLFRFEPR